MTPAWSEFIRESDADLRRSNLNRGMAFVPDRSATTVELVTEYLTGFAGTGATAREVTAAVQRDERGVKRALRVLVDDGRATFTESLTRGPRASKRKTYRPAEASAVMLSMPEFHDNLAVYGDSREYGAGGGREILPKHTGE